MARKKPDPKPAQRKATPREIEASAQAYARVATFPARPEAEVRMVGQTEVAVGDAHDAPHQGATLFATMATRSSGFMSTLVNLLINGARSSGSPCTSDDLNAGLAFVAALDPANEAEAVLAVHAYNCHVAAMGMLAKARGAQHPEGLNGFGNLATKLSRTFTMQIEALAKLKRGGEQVVKHVHVHDGAQAVVAEQFHHHTGGSKNETIEQSYAAACSGAGAALPRPDPLGGAVPVPGSERPEALQDARRDESGGADRE